jgi:MFS transporter, ACS family, tartrate transporter
MHRITADTMLEELSADDIEKSAIRSVSYRIIPFLILSYFICVLDRVNVSFAALTMNADLKFTPLVYAWGAGIFFVGYFLLEVPSNVALYRFGARRWIARIMVTWGMVSASSALVSGPYSFYALRFMLGVAEAGFFPGIILYLTFWYPAKYRARVMSAFILGAPLSAVLGGPICGYLLELNAVGGLKGWQWLFICEGIPAVLLGIFAFFYLTDQPSKAQWLRPAQRAWLEERIASEALARERAHRMTLREALTSPKVMALSFVYFGVLAGLYGIQFWLPQIVKAFGMTNVETGFVSSLPFAFGTVAMFVWGRRSDKSRERMWHVALPLFFSAAGLVASAYAGNFVLTMMALIAAAVGGFSAFGLFWTLPTAYLSGVAAAGAIALINSIGSLAGFGGPYLIGWVREVTGSTITGMILLALLPAAAGLVVLKLGDDQNSAFAEEAGAA